MSAVEPYIFLDKVYFNNLKNRAWIRKPKHRRNWFQSFVEMASCFE